VILGGIGGSNLEMLRRVAAPTQGVDVAAFLRELLTGDTSTASPEQGAGLAALLDLLAPEFELDVSALDMPGFGVLRGRESMRDFWVPWLEEWEHYSWSWSDWSEIGDHVIVDVHIRGTGRSSGAEVRWNQCQVFTLRDAKLLRWEVFPDRGSALATIDRR
jgi:ketosteroid isomerase-like protein